MFYSRKSLFHRKCINFDLVDHVDTLTMRFQISAQESRRKKKEYIESLEKKWVPRYFEHILLYLDFKKTFSSGYFLNTLMFCRVKNLNEDNTDLRRRLENSESTNRWVGWFCLPFRFYQSLPWFCFCRSLAEQMSKYQSLLKGKVQVAPVRRAISLQVEKVSSLPQPVVGSQIASSWTRLLSRTVINSLVCVFRVV